MATELLLWLCTKSFHTLLLVFCIIWYTRFIHPPRVHHKHTKCKLQSASRLKVHTAGLDLQSFLLVQFPASELDRGKKEFRQIVHLGYPYLSIWFEITMLILYKCDAMVILIEECPASRRSELRAAGRCSVSCSRSFHQILLNCENDQKLSFVTPNDNFKLCLKNYFCKQKSSI